ncbi:MAG: peptide chain release factor 1 [Ilumatobacteraceae bacterium]|nr:peptide chain release factor 1 [Ilumatobacteraceae bacterium]MDA0201798.1 peptide chain release factor 1 [Actinomycetota bacterium]MDA2973587.1 peptide chain release factor 1 [Actinomycetota bacterium]MDA3009166.1 peptide chain release factor 1 [Actinomycetota bacterium]
MIARLGLLADEYRELEARLADPATAADPARLTEVARRYRALEPVVAALAEHDRLVGDVAAAESLIESADDGERGQLTDEIDIARERLGALALEMRALLIPPDPDAGRAVIMEIRGAEGGEEANLFAGDLLAMYRAYAQRHGWGVEVLDHDESDLGGVNQVTLVIRGDDAWRRLKHEGGPHRVQRVPVTESQGRVHTSSATVAVLPEADEVDVRIDEADLDIDVYRSSGAGGQHVNTTDSAVRITHRPTGIVVTMQDQRSQLQNRARALQVLRSRVYELERARVDGERSADRRSQVGGGGRSEKIRTYNFKEGRVTDHRIGLTIHRLPEVLAGDLDPVVDALIADEGERLLAEGGA